MYLLNKLLKVNWAIEPTTDTILLADLDILIKPPEAAVIYTNAAVLTANYKAPTSTTYGTVVHTFTPDALGLWLLILTNGVEASNTFYYEHKILVSTYDIRTDKYVPGNLL